RGELHVARRETTQAAVAFESAAKLATRADALEQGQLQETFGRYLRRARQRRAATERLSAAYDNYRRLGATPFLDRCEPELAACGLTTTRNDGRSPTALTPQEVAVSRLVAAGLTNHQVAQELFLSPKTVEYHLGHIFTKLGVTSRTQLAARHGEGGIKS